MLNSKDGSGRFLRNHSTHLPNYTASHIKELYFWYSQEESKFNAFLPPIFFPPPLTTLVVCGPGSSVGIANDYVLHGPGIESRWVARFSAPVQTDLGVHPASCTMGPGSFLGVKCGRGVLLTTHPLLVPRSWKSIAMPLPTLWSTPGL
jgi:hypothetical protein